MIGIVGNCRQNNISGSDRPLSLANLTNATITDNVAAAASLISKANMGRWAGASLVTLPL